MKYIYNETLIISSTQLFYPIMTSPELKIVARLHQLHFMQNPRIKTLPQEMIPGMTFRPVSSPGRMNVSPFSRSAGRMLANASAWNSGFFLFPKITKIVFTFPANFIILLLPKQKNQKSISRRQGLEQNQSSSSNRMTINIR